MRNSIAGTVRREHEDQYLEDESGKRFQIPPDLEQQFPDNTRAYADIVIPIAASVWDGRVICRNWMNSADIKDNHLIPPPHPEARKTWEVRLNEDRKDPESGNHLYGTKIKTGSKSEVKVETYFQARSIESCRKILETYQSLFPENHTLEATCSLIARNGLEIEPEFAANLK